MPQTQVLHISTCIKDELVVKAGARDTHVNDTYAFNIAVAIGLKKLFDSESWSF